MAQRFGSGPYYAAGGGGGSGSGSRYGSSADVRNFRGARQAPPSPRIAAPPLMPQQFTDALERLPPPSEWPSQILSYLVVDPLLNLFRFVLEVAISPRTHRIVLRLSVLSALLWTALGLAIAGYVGFYRAWVPDIGVTRTVWLQYGYDRPPYAEIPLHNRLDRSSGIFAEDQEYDVSLDLVVPLSAANLDLGNFMVALELRSAQNTTVHFISKPCIIVHEPAPIRAMNNLMFQLTRNAPAFILPTSSPPVQLMTIPLLYRAVLEPASASHPFASTVTAGVVSGHVTVGRHDANKYWVYGGGHGVGGVMPETGILKAAANYEGYRSRGELQTHSASLRFDAHLTGLRYFMYHHPLASFLLFTSLFMAFELVSALTLWAIAAFYTSTLTQPSLGVEDNYMGRLGRMTGGTTTGSAQSTPRPSNEDDGFGSDTPVDPETDDTADGRGSHRDGGMSSSTARQQSLASLQARDAQEAYDQRRAEMLRDELEGRRMTAVDQPDDGLDDLLELAQERRVLGRLDEETEEETDVHASETSAGWEDVGEEDDGYGAAPGREQARGEEQVAMAGDDDGAEGAQGSEALRLRRRTVKDEDDDARFRESTVGGSSTSRASSVRSFGATSLGTGATSSVAPTSRSQTQATPEIKEEEEEGVQQQTIEEDEDEDDTEDTERDDTAS